MPRRHLPPRSGDARRRINGKYIAPEAKHLTERVEEVKTGTLLDDVRALMAKSDDEIRDLYNTREIEK